MEGNRRGMSSPLVQISSARETPRPSSAGGASLTIASGNKTLLFGGDGSGVGGSLTEIDICEASGDTGGRVTGGGLGTCGGGMAERTAAGLAGGPKTEKECAMGSGEVCLC